MKLLRYEDIPRSFALTIEAQSGFPCIRIYDDVLGKVRVYDDQVIEDIRRSLGLEEKSFPFQKTPTETYGFGDSLIKTRHAFDQTTYLLNLPAIRQVTNKSCGDCHGKGKDRRGTCIHCSGTGKKMVIDHAPAYALSASIGLLVNELSLAAEDNERKSLPDEKQFLTLRLRVDQGLHGGSLNGDFSPHFINALKTYGEDVNFASVADAMLKAYVQMWPSGHEELGYLRSSIRAGQNSPGNLMLIVPGDACEIHPSPYVHEIPKNEGCEWTCHNVDTPLQQLTLLTGLAAMCDMVR